MTAQPAPRRMCIFCRKPKKMSKEHIWGDWLKTHVPIAMNKHRFQAVHIQRPGAPDIAGIRIRAGDPLRSSVPVVCVDCNNQLLSDIQNRAKPHLIPLITGRATAVGPEAQAHVAAWCAMATMTAEYIDRDPRTIAVPQEHRNWLMTNGTVPPGWRIWIASYIRHKWPAQWIHLTLPILPAAEVPPNQDQDEYALPNTQVTTFVVGQLYVHVMSSADPANISKWSATFSHAAPLLVPLYPQKEPFIAWPPTSLTDRSADMIASAFHLHVEGISRSLLGRRLF